MTRRLHILCASIALLMIVTFWITTVASESLAAPDTVARVKTAILWGMLVLVPAMAGAGITGHRLARGWRLPQIRQKTRRMGVIAVNGLLVLLPSAVFLALRAQAGLFDTWFYAVQAVELTAGAVNITLLGLNMRAGMALRLRRRPA
ncbi:hypothetical protein [Shimia sp.]|uniref:hypothetical protein n=1 Tax=Shimia sp. TaxID=1954381 RepID=UPI00356354C0